MSLKMAVKCALCIRRPLNLGMMSKAETSCWITCLLLVYLNQSPVCLCDLSPTFNSVYLKVTRSSYFSIYTGNYVIKVKKLTCNLCSLIREVELFADCVCLSSAVVLIARVNSVSPHLLHTPDMMTG